MTVHQFVENFCLCLTIQYPFPCPPLFHLVEVSLLNLLRQQTTKPTELLLSIAGDIPDSFKEMYRFFFKQTKTRVKAISIVIFF